MRGSILVTRPRPQGEILCDLICQHGWSALYLPTIEIVSLVHLPKVRQQLSSEKKYDWIIITSPQAAKYSLKFIKNISADTKVAAIGGGTAKILKNAQIFIDAYPVGQWSSEGLLDLIDFHHVKDQKIAIIKGVGGRTLLEDVLSDRQAIVESIAVYERKLPYLAVANYLKMIQDHNISIVISTSNNGLENLLILLKDVSMQLKKMILIVVSERMMEYAKKLGFQKIVLAQNASHEAILATLQSL